MSKKTFLIAAAAIAALLAAAAYFTFRFYLTPERVIAWTKPPLESYLKREVNVQGGRVDFRGLELQGVDIRRRGETTPLLRAQAVELRLDPWALLQLQLKVKALVFRQPEVTIVRAADGAVDIADLFRETVATPPGAAQERSAPSDRALPLLISLLSIDNGRITFVDHTRKPAATLRLTRIDSSLQGLAHSGPLQFSLAADLEAGKESSRLTIAGSYEPAQHSIEATLEATSLYLAPLSPYLHLAGSTLAQGKIDTKLTCRIARLDQIEAQGQVGFKGLTFSIAQQPSGNLHGKADFIFTGRRSSRTFTLEQLDLLLNGQELHLEGELSQTSPRPEFRFSFSSPSLRLDELLDLLPGGKQAQAATTSGPKESGNDSSPAAKAEKTANANNHVVPPSPRLFPIPAHWDARGAIKMDWLYYKSLVASNVAGKLTYKSGDLMIEPLSASMYGGQLNGKLQANLSRAPVRFRSHFSLKNVLVGELVRGISPASEPSLEGNLSLETAARGQGTRVELLESQTDLSASQVNISNHPLLRQLAELMHAEELQSLQFDQVQGKLRTAGGTTFIDRLDFSGPVGQITAGGKLGLLDKSLDLDLVLRLPVQLVGKQPLLRPLLPLLADAAGFVRVPLQLSGTLDAPRYGLRLITEPGQAQPGT